MPAPKTCDICHCPVEECICGKEEESLKPGIKEELLNTNETRINNQVDILKELLTADEGKSRIEKLLALTKSDPKLMVFRTTALERILNDFISLFKWLSVIAFVATLALSTSVSIVDIFTMIGKLAFG